MVCREETHWDNGSGMEGLILIKHINRARYVSVRQAVQGSVDRLVPGFMAPDMKRYSYLGIISLQRDSAVFHERSIASFCNSRGAHSS